MKPSRLSACVCALVAFASTACGAGAAKPPLERVGVTTVERVAGEDAPRGAHFTLDVIGVPKGKTADLAGDDGHHFFVSLAGRTNILLGEGDFLVVDANGTDGTASFQLPNPDPARAGTVTYSVWARALATPASRGKASRCTTDASTGDVFCSVAQRVRVRGAGASSFTDVSNDLLYLRGDGDDDGHALFDSAFGDAFCQSDNAGRRVAQLRFYAM